jgi:hypothetical protein
LLFHCDRCRGLRMIDDTKSRDRVPCRLSRTLPSWISLPKQPTKVWDSPEVGRAIRAAYAFVRSPTNIPQALAHDRAGPIVNRMPEPDGSLYLIA